MILVDLTNCIPSGLFLVNFYGKNYCSLNMLDLSLSYDSKPFNPPLFKFRVTESCGVLNLLIRLLFFLC